LILIAQTSPKFAQHTSELQFEGEEAFEFRAFGETGMWSLR